MSWFFGIFLLVGFVFWVFGLRVGAKWQAVPQPDTESGSRDLDPKISVIIPARNEETNLKNLLPSIPTEEGGPLEIIVVDDHSTDATASVAETFGARLLTGKELPEGWFGKPWACAQGAEAAKGEWLLFLDADVVFEPEGFNRVAALAKDSGTVHSICPWHRIERPYEEFSAFFNVIMLLGINAFTNRGAAAEKIGLFGQAMLVARSDYEKVGGHDKVRQVVLENFHLSREFAREGIACRSYIGRGVLSMRMFADGPRQLIAGWAKGFVSGANNTPKSAMIGISCWLSACMMSLISLTFLPLASLPIVISISLFYALCAIQAVIWFSKAGNFSVWNGLLFPISLSFYQWVFFSALRRKRRGETVKWKGRDVS
ncbi:MAG: glycosyltransferase [Verrucomicrobiota bacterium]